MLYIIGIYSEYYIHYQAIYSCKNAIPDKSHD